MPRRNFLQILTVLMATGSLSTAEAAEFPKSTGKYERGCNIAFGKELPPESLAANQQFAEYLQENAKASETLRMMADRIRNFRKHAPRLFASKCIDGRAHGSDGKGYPITTVTFSRTEGNKVALTGGNSVFWNRLNGVVEDAAKNTPGCPALFIALGHRATQGSGCAAHHEDNAAALQTVADQATEIRKRYQPSELYVLHGMTNTDDGAERIIFPNGEEIDTEKIIQALDTDRFPLKKASDVFQPDFLTSVIDDVATKRLLNSRKPEEIIHGPDAAMFRELGCTVAMESYLLEEISRINVNRTRNNVVFNTELFTYLQTRIDGIDGLPTELKPALLYQTLWNIAYTLHRRERNVSLKEKPKELSLEIEHAEDKVAYGEGFEIEPRNTLVLVKPGRGDDQEALAVARNVLLKNRNRRKEQQHPPLVHINVEVAGTMETWQSFNQNVLSKLHTMMQNAHAVFGQDCRILTSYSYLSGKRFFPVRLSGDPTTNKEAARESFPSDVSSAMNEDNFSANALRLQEDAYTNSMLTA